MLLTLFIRHSTSFYPQFSFFCVMIVRHCDWRWQQFVCFWRCGCFWFGFNIPLLTLTSISPLLCLVSVFCLFLFLLPFKGSVGWMVIRLLCIQRHNACKNSGSRRHNVYDMSTKCACATKQRNPLFSFIILLISSSALSAASRVVVVASISTDLSYGVDSVTLLVREEEYYVVNFVLSVVRFSFCLSIILIADHCLLSSPCGAYLTTNWVFLSSQGQEILRHRRNRNITTTDLFVLSAWGRRRHSPTQSRGS